MPHTPARDRLIVALDMPTLEAARVLVHALAETVTFYKVGLELLFVGGLQFAQELRHMRKRVFLDTTKITEPDLVEVGDEAMINHGAVLQTHLFEDRVMKMSHVRIGAGATVGTRSVVLYDAEVGTDSFLDAYSLVMKGEVLPPQTRWRGIPARPL